MATPSTNVAVYTVEALSEGHSLYCNTSALFSALPPEATFTRSAWVNCTLSAYTHLSNIPKISSLLTLQAFALFFSTYLVTLGTRSPTNTAIIAITTINSISEKPLFLRINISRYKMVNLQ